MENHHNLTDIFSPTRPVPTVQHWFSPHNGRTGRCLPPRRHTPGARDDSRKLSKHKQILLNAAKSAILFPIRAFLTASYGGLHNSPSKKKKKPSHLRPGTPKFKYTLGSYYRTTNLSPEKGHRVFGSSVFLRKLLGIIPTHSHRSISNPAVRPPQP